VTEPRRIGSGGPWEERAAYSRAVVVGDTCWVSGATDAGPDGRARHPGDVAAQARAVLDVIDRALADAGFAREDVVRIRMFVTDIGRADEVIAVLDERFREIRPAATMVEVSRLIEPSLLIEIEADARRG